MKISIVVITYNSSKYIIETLESIRKQSYSNIELIITDDASNDNTLFLCNEWISKHISRFNGVYLLDSDQNKGITFNLEKGYKTATGIWIKPIAGDDVLDVNCIQNYVNFVQNNSKVKIIQSNSSYYKNNFNEDNLIFNRKVQKEFLMMNQKSVEFQRKILLYSPSVNAPTVFISKELLEEIDYLNKDISYMDDWPLWLKINKFNVLINEIDFYSVKYRIHDNSISNNGKFVNKNFKQIYQYQLNNLWEELTLIDKCFILYEYYLKTFYYKISTTKNVKILKKLYVISYYPIIFYSFLRYKYYYIKYK